LLATATGSELGADDDLFKNGFAHNIDLSRFRHAIDDEASELSSFAAP